MARRLRPLVFLRRFCVPRLFVTAYYMLRYRTRVSLRAEVELSGLLRFGRRCVVSSFTKIKASNGPVVIGRRGGFATGCFVSSGLAGIRIGDNFVCGPSVNIVASNYRYDQPGVHLEDQGRTSKGIRIGDNVWLGAGCTVLDGSVIGDNTIVVANSLINRRFPPNVILQGNPAKIIMKRSPPAEDATKAPAEVRQHA